MFSLETIKRMNAEAVNNYQLNLVGKLMGHRVDDDVDSWDPANYADPIVDDVKWGCGIQPWSRGNPECANGITEDEYKGMKIDKLIIDPNPSRSINLWG